MGKSKAKEKKSKFEKEISWKRNLIFFWVTIIALALIGINSLNIREKKVIYEYPEAVYYYGYNLADTTYTPDETSEHYLEMEYLGEKSLRALHLYYNTALEEDLNVSVDFMDGDTVVKSIPYIVPKGETYGKVYVGDNTTSMIRVYSNQSFSFSGAAFEHIDASGENAKIKIAIVIAAIIMLIITWLLSFLIKVDDIIDKIVEAVKKACSFKDVTEKSIFTAIWQISAFLIAGIIVWGILKKVLFGQDWELGTNNIMAGIMIGLLPYMIFIFWKKRMSFERLYLYCGLIIGTTFAVVLPMRLNVSWDDQIHYMSAISGSRLTDSTVSLAEEDFYYTCFNRQLKDYEQYNRDELKEIINNPLSEKAYVVNPVSLSPIKTIVYAPVSLILFLARGIGFPTTMCIILGRIAGVWSYILLIYFGMRRIKSGKMIMAAVSLVPGYLFIVSNYNYDYWTIALIAYSMAYLLGEYQHPEKPIEIKDIIIIFSSFLIALLTKPVYIPLLGLAAFIPKEKFKTVRFRRIYRGFFITACCLAVAAVLFFLLGGFLGTGDNRGGEDVNAGLQIEFIFSNPKLYMQIIFNYMKEYLNLDMVYSYLANKAYYGNDILLAQITLIWIGIVTLADRNYLAAKNVGWSSKILSLPLAYLSVWATATAMYVIFTPVGYSTVNGCQGRYLFPIVIPLLLFLSQIRFIKQDYTEKVQKIIETIAMTGTLVLAVRMVMYFC